MVCKIIVLFLIFFTSLNAQISPGDLTNAHAKYEGISNCTKCHVLGKQVQDSKCLDCHSVIKNLIQENRGYHSGADAKGKNCWNCHSEHHGRNFRIINFNTNGFDHSKAGFNLTGKHSEIKCEDCHKSDFIQIKNASLRKNTLLGLSQSCRSCHTDIHEGKLGELCSSCHNTTNFSTVENFDHSKTRYKLTGAHLNVACLKCHPSEIKNGKQNIRLIGISFSTCESCHKDVHESKFGKDCQSCHVTAGFKLINQKFFDHNKTDFPLIGKHQLVICAKCHGDNLNTKPRHQNCIDCHSDYHNGEFSGATLKDCSVCHTEKGFEPSTFTIKEHNEIKFKLTGAHLAVPCKSCHFNNDKWHFKNIGNKCIDCHKNVHGTEIIEKFMQNNQCENCHFIDDWKNIKFNHELTTFPLNGKHKEVSCGECHYKVEDTGNKKFRFVSLSSKCEGCHKDVHYGQFIENGNSDCERCHIFDSWKPEKFNHNSTRFSLEGAHQKLACSRCHPVITENNNQFIKYKLDDFKCAACHS
ncbi:MAG TPA: hypothetical protein VLB50_00690 [Ignavibacteriaceae bacterium]|nr:hypothetical protein [Ignavibacteriaceae bacterium]